MIKQNEIRKRLSRSAEDEVRKIGDDDNIDVTKIMRDPGISKIFQDIDVFFTDIAVRLDERFSKLDNKTTNGAEAVRIDIVLPHSHQS